MLAKLFTWGRGPLTEPASPPGGESSIVTSLFLSQSWKTDHLSKQSTNQRDEKACKDVWACTSTLKTMSRDNSCPVQSKRDRLWNSEILDSHSLLLGENRLQGVLHFLLTLPVPVTIREPKICKREADKWLEEFAPVQMLLLVTVVFTQQLPHHAQGTKQLSGIRGYSLKVRFLGEVENCKIEETGDFCAGANFTRSDPSATRHQCQALKQSQKLKTRSSVYWLRGGKLQIVPGCTPRIFGDPGRKKE